MLNTQRHKEEHLLQHGQQAMLACNKQAMLACSNNFKVLLGTSSKAQQHHSPNAVPVKSLHGMLPGSCPHMPGLLDADQQLSAVMLDPKPAAMDPFKLLLDSSRVCRRLCSGYEVLLQALGTVPVRLLFTRFSRLSDGKLANPVGRRRR